MSEQKDNFEFEVESSNLESKGKPEVDIEVIDDTPEEDRGREPLPKELLAELEADELDDYSDKVKTRFKQMKKVYHDERREKERAFREQQEAIGLAQKMMEENKRLKSTLYEGEKTLVDTYKTAAELEMEMASRAYKEAYETGDSDRVVEAQKKMSDANWKLQRVKEYRPSVQNEENGVNSTQSEVQIPRPDPKTRAWQERNTWFGQDPEMTALALGLHQKLERQHGEQYIGTDEYWGVVNKTIRHRFPEYFGDSEGKTTDGGGKPVQRNESKPATVVAPASRSTSSKKIVLKQSQLSIAKKLGLTPEQYAREYAKTMEN
jgi:hypothetical protein